jgi:hypothetical protein
MSLQTKRLLMLPGRSSASRQSIAIPKDSGAEAVRLVRAFEPGSACLSLASSVM